MLLQFIVFKEPIDNITAKQLTFIVSINTT